MSDCTSPILPPPAQIADAWERYPHAAGALIVSPTPYGTCADIAAIAAICHERDKPLIVDEAWGAHLPFHAELPTWAMDADADVCVVSVHKMGVGFEQGSVFHLQGERVDFAHLSACADLLMTTSPNVLLYSAIDGWRRQMAEQGQELLEAALGLVERTRRQIDEIPGLRVLREELIREEASHDLDPLQVLIDLTDLEISGYQASDWLRENELIDVGLSDHARILATFSFADDASSADRLLSALRRLTAAAAELPKPKRVELPQPRELELETVNRPRDAFFSRFEDVEAKEAVGRIAAEQVTPYPPGIPAILPGERITVEVIEYLQGGVQAGMVLPDPVDPSLGTIRVMR
jgi:arginine/lysine/ornithine decarboxylase